MTKGISENIILLKFEIQKSDIAYVVERAHYADWKYGKVTDKTEAIRKYVSSRIPAAEYEGNYLLPELIIKNSIPLERIIPHKKITRILPRKPPHEITYISDLI